MPEGGLHVLRYGLPLCGFSNEVPAKWPAGNRWVPIDDLKHATCKQCVINAQQVIRGFGQDEFCYAPPLFEMTQEPGTEIWHWKLTCDKCRDSWTSTSRMEAVDRWAKHDCHPPPTAWERISADDD